MRATYQKTSRATPCRAGLEEALRFETQPAGARSTAAPRFAKPLRKATRRWSRRIRGTFLALAIAGVPIPASPGDEAERVRKSSEGRLDARHFSARVRLVLESSDYRERRALDIWRDDQKGTRERVMLRFREPPDLRGLSLLYLESRRGPSDYFLHRAGTGRVRRISATLAEEDLYGIDLAHLGFALSRSAETRASRLRRIRVDGRPLLELVDRPLAEGAPFDRRVRQIDPQSWATWRTEHWVDGERVLLAQTIRMQRIHEVVTPMEVVFERPRRGAKVSLVVESIDYRSKIPRAYFSTFALVKER